MKVFRVVAPPDERSAAVEALITGLSAHGRVATIGTADSEASTGRDDSSADTTVTIGDDRWHLVGTGVNVSDILRRLAPTHDFAIFTDSPEMDCPVVRIGDPAVERDRTGPTIVHAPSAAGLDSETVLQALESVDAFETLSSLVASVEASADQDRGGAIATFTGRVRERDGPDDPPTEFLEFERYEDVAAERMASIRADLRDQEGIYGVELYHRTGVVEAGEHIVHVVILAGHRRQAFSAVEAGIDRLKDEVPLFKREVTVEEEFWVHERD